MTLELRQLVTRISDMSTAMDEYARDIATRLATALATWRTQWSEPDRVRAKVGAARTSWLLASPTEETKVVAAPGPPSPSWRVLATDGSQIEMSRHEIAPCFVVNIGEVVLDYGEAPGARLTSAASLSYSDEDLHPLFGGEERRADGAIVAAVRDTAELSRLTAMVKDADRPAVAMVDGTLILWRDGTDPRGLGALDPADLKRRRLDAMLALFDSGRTAGVPVVGYISSPGGTDVVNALKVMLCPEDPVDCDRCPFTPAGVRRATVRDKPCDPIDRLSDRALFSRLLAPGERSPLFWSGAPVLAAYGPRGVAFAYLNTGYEIARLEVPSWVVADETAMSLAHGVVQDQTVRGFGYPVALAEAHEAAVVRGPDREAFFALVSRRMAKDGHPVLMSRKQFRKRGAMV